jgi:hypothetical protein
MLKKPASLVVCTLVLSSALGIHFALQRDPVCVPDCCRPASSSVLPVALALEDKKEAAGDKPAAEKAAVAAAIEQDPTKGWLEGRITFEGDLPDLPPKTIPDNNRDKATCAAHLKEERLIVSEKKELKDVVVSVANHKPAEKPKPRTPLLDNKNCTFVPHVQATTVGSKLKVTNSDAFMHNSRGALALSFNPAIGPGQPFESPVLRKKGWGVVSCDFHPWMQAHVWVFEHDLFAVTAADGTFKIPNIPPGEHEIELWHEFPVEQNVKRKVKIEAGKGTTLDAALKAGKK